MRLFKLKRKKKNGNSNDKEAVAHYNEFGYPEIRTEKVRKPKNKRNGVKWSDR